jgi:hypothetical protein
MADQPLPPPCPRPPRFVHVPLKQFPKEQAEAAGAELLKRHDRAHHKVQPLSRTNAVAALTLADEAQFAALEVELGGRQRLAALLRAADVPDRDLSLATLLIDPANDTTSLAQLCTFARVSMRRLLEFVKEASLIRGQVKSLIGVGNRLPDVALSLMDDAVSGERVCPTCRGTRMLCDEPTIQTPNPAPHACPVCDGVGTINYQPDVKLREIALQLGKLLDKPGNTNNVFVATKFGDGTAPSFNASVMELDQALDGKTRDRFGRRIVEGESTLSSTPVDDVGDRPLPDA